MSFYVNKNVFESFQSCSFFSVSDKIIVLLIRIIMIYHKPKYIFEKL